MSIFFSFDVSVLYFPKFGRKSEQYLLMVQYCTIAKTNTGTVYFIALILHARHQAKALTSSFGHLMVSSSQGPYLPWSGNGLVCGFSFVFVFVLCFVFLIE